MDISDPKKLRRIKREERRGLKISNLVHIISKGLDKLSEGIEFLETNITYLSVPTLFNYIENSLYSLYDNSKVVQDLKYKKLAKYLTHIVEKFENDDLLHKEAPISEEIQTETNKGYIEKKRLYIGKEGLVECTNYSLSQFQSDKLIDQTSNLENTIQKSIIELPSEMRRIVPKEEFLQIVKTYGKNNLHYVYLPT